MQPPITDPDSEELVIGTLLSATTDAAYWLNLLTVECFYDPRLQFVYRAMTDVLERGDVVNILSVEEQLRLQYPNSHVSPADLAVWMQLDRPENIRNAVTILHQMRVRRALQQISNQIEATVALTDQPVEKLVELVQSRMDALDVSPMSHGLTLCEVAPLLRQRIQDNLSPHTRHYGPLTGIDQIDRHAPLPEKGLVILAAASSHGKSAFANLITLTSARNQMRVAVFSKEMANESTLARMVAMGTTDTSASHIMNCQLNMLQYQATEASLQQLERQLGTSILFDDSRSLQLSDVTASIRRMHQKHHIRVAFIDYLQLLAHDTVRNRNITQEQLMGQYARTLKNLGDQLGICIVALSQLNRNLPQGRPNNAQIRDSGQIAEAADYILMLWRPERYHGSYDAEYAQCDTHNTALVIVDKNREGPTLDTLVGWRPTTTTFFGLSAEQIQAMKEGRVVTYSTAELQKTLFD